jgi:glycogen synthase
LRIALVVPEFPPFHIGGGGVVFEALAKQFSQTNDVRVFTASDANRSWMARRAATTRSAISVYRYPLVPIGTGSFLRSAAPPNPLAAIQLSSDLNAWHPDVAHLHGYGHLAVDLSALLLSSRRHAVPYAFTVHGFPLAPARGPWLLRKAYAAYQAVGAGRTIRQAAAVTAVSKAVARQLGIPGRVDVVPNGVDRLPASDPVRSDQMRRRLDLPGGAPVVAAGGRLARNKGFDILLRALPLVSTEQLACVIAGADGGELASLMSLAKSLPERITVRFPGWLDRAYLADLFSLASVVAVPSREEPFGLVALEGLGLMRRVVAGRVGGLAEFVDTPAADLIDGEDPIRWALALRQALRRGPLTAHESASIEALLATHSWPRISQEYESILARCARS